MKLSNNNQLYEYMVLVSTKLKDAGLSSLSEVVQSAARTATANPATEFLGESRKALSLVLTNGASCFTESERADLLDVLSQIDRAFNER